MSQQGHVATNTILEPGFALAGKLTVTSQMAVCMSLADIPQFLASHVRFVERDSHIISHNLMHYRISPRATILLPAMSNIITTRLEVDRIAVITSARVEDLINSSLSVTCNCFSSKVYNYCKRAVAVDPVVRKSLIDKVFLFRVPAGAIEWYHFHTHFYLINQYSYALLVITIPSMIRAIPTTLDAFTGSLNNNAARTNTITKDELINGYA